MKTIQDKLSFKQAVALFAELGRQNPGTEYVIKIPTNGGKRYKVEIKSAALKKLQDADLGISNQKVTDFLAENRTDT